MNEGILLLNKPQGKTSFYLVKILRSITGIKKIGHAGTLDPFATGLMVMLVGKNYTVMQSKFMHTEKEYMACVRLGISTDTYDLTGNITASSKKIPSDVELKTTLLAFQGKIQQMPPMYSAKKIQGKKLYELARKGIEINRKSAEVELNIELLNYVYPDVFLHITCSSGTYIRSLAFDLGCALQTGAHLFQLERIRSGNFTLSDALDISKLDKTYYTHLKR